MKELFWNSLFTILLLISQFAYSQENTRRAPLYWSVYEYHREKEKKGISDNYIPEDVFMQNIQMVDSCLKPVGYNMVCIDGWGDMDSYNQYGYRTKHSIHWNHDYQWWADTLQKMGMNLGMYHNPLWINEKAAKAGCKIKGTDYPLKNLLNEDEESIWFNWLQIDQPGAEEYIKGNIRFYANMGITYLRVDFLSWYQDGYDKNMGRVGPTRLKEHYETALKWMHEACEENGIFLSLVMPHLKNEAELELLYGDMIRINEDVWDGGWERFSNFNRGKRSNSWSQWSNAFDGYTYWSYISGRDKIILDGDFIRLNTLNSYIEKQTVISLHLMAGGPLSPADLAGSTMTKENLALYTNPEMLALNADGFVGKPLSNDPTIDSSQIWRGQMSNGDWIIGLFNREDKILTRQYAFTNLGLTGKAGVRNLWTHEDLGDMDSISANIPPHGCLILKLSTASETHKPQSIGFKEFETKIDIQETPYVILQAEAESGLPVQFECVYGPAELAGDTLHFTGRSGKALIMSTQQGNDTYGAAIPQPLLVEVSDAQMPYEHFYIVGDGSPLGWDIAAPQQFTPVEGNPYQFIWEGELQAGELKFSTFTGDWCDGDWLLATISDQDISEPDFSVFRGCPPRNKDFKWRVKSTQEGYYTIIIDMENNAIHFNRELPYDSLYLVGDASPSGWDISDPEPFIRDKTNPLVFTWVGYLNAGELKFSTFKGDWCDGDWILATKADQNPSVSGYNIYEGCPPESEDLKWEIAQDETGEYKITVNLENKTVVFDKQDVIEYVQTKSDNWQIFPNPTKDQINLTMPSTIDKAVLTIYNSMGIQILQKQINTSKTNVLLPTRNTSPFVLIHVRSRNSYDIFKIIIQ